MMDSPQPDYACHCRGLSMGFPGRPPLLENVTLAVRSREFVGLAGPSGSGKSSLARLIHGRPPRGLEFTGAPVWKAGPSAYIAQEPALSLSPFLRVGAQIRHCLPAGQDFRAVTPLLDAAGLRPPEQMLRRFPHQLSGGERQRIAWIQALVQSPRLLIADEPTTALDTVSQRAMVELALELARSRRAAVLWISHDLDLLTAVCDRVLRIENGRITSEGAPA